ncbi:hypothetical protein Corgl_0092 [Coriobacterium glomerans PW2]|uniref:Flavodoxin-like domain-containing protein n=1 Tax=Coriobacterium glomerans (strain ATCC 49209 / DSM 20642 / JCM 10262 / PW2) TaxID=700015 RepID=F2N9W5_CORGP|nr:flavodoxin family protein BilS [Coriobacterium glomerans]AEB06220.1 hypothetical protein Corgl_0092 [Coriobacterium glomerans PW2]
MKYAIVINSRSGNTRLVGNALMRALAESNGRAEAMYVGDIPPADGETCSEKGASQSEPACGSVEMIQQADTILFGFWTDKGDCTQDAARFLQTLSGKRVFLFGTAGFGGSQAYFDRILATVRSHLPADADLAGSVMCQGKMDVAVRRRYEAMLGQDPQDARAKAMIENFDEALAHPDESDFQTVITAAKSSLHLS